MKVRHDYQHNRNKKDNKRMLWPIVLPQYVNQDEMDKFLEIYILQTDARRNKKNWTDL